MIEKQVTFEGILREEEEQSNETARLQDYRMAAITKDATYILVDALPYDFIVTNVFYRITEGAGFGYDPADVTNTVSETSGTATVAAVDVTWTCTAGGTIGPFRYVVLYNDTATNDPLIAYWDYGSSITLNPGESFTVNFADDKLFTLA